MSAMATLEEPTTVIDLTERAAAKIKELLAEEPDGESSVLRVAVQGGGCSGFEYALGFDRGAQEGDHELEAHGVRVVVDPFSAPYLQGAHIDFLDGLQESERLLGLRLRTLVPGRGRRCRRGARYRRWAGARERSRLRLGLQPLDNIRPAT
jgi:iron-sulfur cluster assembly accessory protein